MDEQQKKIIEKIKKCFALSKSANPNEAATALKQAFALAKKYNMDNNIEELCQMTSGQAISIRSLPFYIQNLLRTIIEIFQTRCVISHEYINNKAQKIVRFFGHESGIIISEYAWKILSRQLTNARNNYLKNNTDNRMKKSTKTRRADIYAMGWLNGVDEGIKHLNRFETEEMKEAHQEKIKEYQRLVFNGTLQSSKLKKAPVNNNDRVSRKEYGIYLNGISDGQTIRIDKGINGTNPALIETY